jgi:hypothetical protein
MAGHMPETSMETSPTPVQATAGGAGGEGPFWQKMIADKWVALGNGDCRHADMSSPYFSAGAGLMVSSPRCWS